MGMIFVPRIGFGGGISANHQIYPPGCGKPGAGPHVSPAGSRATNRETGWS